MTGEGPKIRRPSRREVLEELRARGFRPERRRGQNFLFDPQLLDAFLDDAGVSAGERILEVGAGAGTLTARLLARGCEVVAVEIDPLLCAYLRDVLDHPRLDLIEGDALAGKNRLAPRLARRLDDWAAPFRLVANLPYQIATPLLHLLLVREPPLVGAGVLLQLELAERWTAVPGSRDYGTTAFILGSCGRGRITRRVPRGLFSPPPRVDSAFLVWRRRGCPSADVQRLEAVGRRLFQQRRKMLRVLLRDEIPPGDPWWREARIDPTARPEQLPQAALQRLAGELERRGRASQG